MKVIDKNDNSSLWSLIIKCTGRGNEFENGQNGNVPCNSLLQINENDVIYVPFKNWNGKVIKYYSFKCPYCNCLTDIPKEKLTRAVEYYVLAKSLAKDESKNNGIER